MYKGLKKFQYIKCDGSAWNGQKEIKLLDHFNTSNVTVQQIHNSLPDRIPRFQYIKCDGSACCQGCF